jgi:hypothetical protein
MVLLLLVNWGKSRAGRGKSGGDFGEEGGFTGE